MKDQIMRAMRNTKPAVKFDGDNWYAQGIEAGESAENARLRPLIEKLAERLEKNEMALRVARRWCDGKLDEARLMAIDSVIADNAAFLKDLTK